MDKSIKKFMGIPTKSKAQILDEFTVEVQTSDGEVFKVVSNLGKYTDKEYKD